MDYLDFVQSEVANATDINGGLKPTEVRLPAGCIAELDAAYQGSPVTDIIALGSNSTVQPTMDTCCQLCR